MPPGYYVIAKADDDRVHRDGYILNIQHTTSTRDHPEASRLEAATVDLMESTQSALTDVRSGRLC
jgi:hypothetical protein